MYSDLYLKQDKPRWPVYLAVGFVVVGIVVSALIFIPQMSFSIPSFADLGLFPQKKARVQRQEVVNMSPHQTGIFWHTEEKESGWIQYGTSETSLRKRAYDERDTEENQQTYTLHIASLKGLTPNTQYYYKIVTDRGVVLQDGTKPFTFKTPESDATINTSADPLYGKVSLPKGTPADDAFVFLYYDDIYPLMTRTKPSGEWLIPLQTVVNKTNNSYVSLGGGKQIRLEIMNEENQFTKIETTVDRASPVSKTVSLGKNYVMNSQGGSVLSEVSKRTGLATGERISLQHPREGAVIPGQRPLVKGTALPDTPVSLTIKANREYTFDVIANERGQWDVDVPVDLSPGSHMVTMRTTDDSGKEKLIRRYFIISQQGQQVLGDATGSGELTPSPEPIEEPEEATPSPTPPPTDFTPTPTEELEEEPTEEPTPEPTEEEEPTPSPTRRPSPSPTPRPTERPTPTESLLKATPTESILKSTPTQTRAPQITDTLVAEPTGERPEPPTAGFVGAPFVIMAVSILIIGAGIVFVL